MGILRHSSLFVAAFGLVLACGGDDGPEIPDAGDAGMGVVRCGGGDDTDADFISSLDEGSEDPDGDGRPNDQDDDSDGDGIPDRVEGGDTSCLTPPFDTDGDGIPDFLDLDSNGDGIPDRDQRDDSDLDGIPDALEPDTDGDGIPNVIETGPDGELVDTDGDGVPDVLDDDSDGDTISDAHEGTRDPDGDGIPAFRDNDSDGDGIEDAVEAGDADLATRPVACAAEIDPVTGEVQADGLDDYLDADSDNDGLSDADELVFGTEICNIDTDGDGFGDLVEGAYETVNCPEGGEGLGCDCATRRDCVIPPEDFFVVLPYLGEPVARDLDFATNIRVADVFFLTDTTGSMSSELARVKSTVSQPGTGLIARISETIPDAWYGGGQHDDFPLSGYGGGSDEPFILAIGMTPPARAEDVETAFNRMSLHGGADGPESQTEALYQLMTGEGGRWTFGTKVYEMRRYVGDCLDTGWGAPCFREGALPIVVHFTDICSHNGPPEETSCSRYSGISPAPADWSDAIEAMNRRGAKYVGVSTQNTSCASVTGPSGSLPCWFMKRTAEETGSVDLDGNPLVYDLPDGGASETAFIDAVVGAIETIATRVPLDVDTAVRDDPDESGVDASLFVTRRQPACRAMPPTDPCWIAPEGIEPDRAVAFVDESTFFGALPGTEVKFRITFQNTTVPGGERAQVFIAFIDVRGGGAAVLDTRQVFIVVPASSGGPVI